MEIIFTTIIPLALLVCFSLLFGTGLHELGHAWFALRASRETVRVYIGSFGDSRDCFRIKRGRLTIAIKKNPFYWYKGVCISDHYYLSTDQHIWLVAGGPIASALTAAVCYAIISLATGILFIRVAAGGLFTISLIGFLTNIIPFKRLGITPSGTYIGSDGYQLYRLLKRRVR